MVSPNIAHLFMSLALSYDEARNITSGYLGYVAVKDTPGDRNQTILSTLINDIKGMESLVSHPLLVPTLCYRLWLRQFEHKCGEFKTQLREISSYTKDLWNSNPTPNTI